MISPHDMNYPGPPKECIWEVPSFYRSHRDIKCVTIPHRQNVRARVQNVDFGDELISSLWRSIPLQQSRPTTNRLRAYILSYSIFRSLGIIWGWIKPSFFLPFQSQSRTNPKFSHFDGMYVPSQMAGLLGCSCCQPLTFQLPLRQIIRVILPSDLGGCLPDPI